MATWDVIYKLDKRITESEKRAIEELQTASAVMYGEDDTTVIGLKLQAYSVSTAIYIAGSILRSTLGRELDVVYVRGRKVS